MGDSTENKRHVGLLSQPLRMQCGTCACPLPHVLPGMLMTDSVGAVYRTMLESLRMLSVWVLDLVIYYTLDGDDHRCADCSGCCQGGCCNQGCATQGLLPGWVLALKVCQGGAALEHRGCCHDRTCWSVWVLALPVYDRLDGKPCGTGREPGLGGNASFFNTDERPSPACLPTLQVWRAVDVRQLAAGPGIRAAGCRHSPVRTGRPAAQQPQQRRPFDAGAGGRAHWQRGSRLRCLLCLL